MSERNRSHDSWKNFHLIALVTATMTLGLSALADRQGEATERVLQFDYKMSLDPTEAQGKPIQLFVPLPRNGAFQSVESIDVVANIEGRIETEPRYGNRFWHATVPKAMKEPVSIEISSVVKRGSRDPGSSPNTTTRPDSTPSQPFLAPNQLVVTHDAILDPILDEMKAKGLPQDPSEKARVIYDWVVDNIEYKKIGTGWGNGDTFWACNERYGNCTDFHSLYISLARTEGIPARFEMGFPVPTDRNHGKIKGYHCWVEFYTEESGWFAIDASEAAKFPEKREHFFGGRSGDRIHFTTGRDLRLGPDHTGRPLNYFIYPYAEIDGQTYSGEIETSFEYQEVAS